MITLLKKIFSFLFKNKKTLFLVLSLTVFFFFLRFPLNEWLEKTFKDLQKKSPLAQEVSFGHLKVKWLPPGLFFEDISFIYQGKYSHLDLALISPSLKHWIALKKAFNVKLQKGDSHVFINFHRKLIEPDEDSQRVDALEVFSIKGFTRLIDLKDLSFLYPNMSGKLQTNFSYKGSLQVLEEITGQLSLAGKSINLSELQLSTALGPLNLPSIQWTEVDMNLEIKDGELVFNKVELGSLKDKIKIKMRGSSSFRLVRRKVIFKSYNIELQVDLDENTAFGFLDLMFANYKEKKSNFYRYSVRLIGKGSQIPKIEKLENF